MTIENVKTLAKHFLMVADELNENVSNYFDGSNDANDVNAYYIVKAEYKKFVDAQNEYFNEDVDYSLDYELAEAFNY